MLPGHIFKNYNHLKLGGAKGRDYFGSRSSCRLPEVANYVLSTERNYYNKTHVDQEV